MQLMERFEIEGYAYNVKVKTSKVSMQSLLLVQNYSLCVIQLPSILLRDFIRLELTLSIHFFASIAKKFSQAHCLVNFFSMF